ncbi:MAG: 30S ribosomal protein S16 [Candidatus Blackburnbacteria bacterium]|nr:30S ribosomal protein S16 [Candidatus Blackburnbacteria bacterium]
MLKIRLSQTGKKHARQYRVVVGEKRSKRDGKVVDTLGFWDPQNKKVKIDKKLYQEWVAKGAQPTKVVQTLVDTRLLSQAE